jgi:hypothetical protein
MMRTVQIVVCVLLIVSVATILITPDPTDDVPGVLHHTLKFQKIFAVWVSGIISVSPLSLRSSAAFVSSRAPDAPPLLTLLCVRLC